jgi:hypothetical protein
MIMIARKSSLLRRLLWAATLATGFGTAWLAIVVWLGNSIQEAWQGGTENWPPRETLVVKSDGTPLIERVTYQNLSQFTYRDLSGRVQDAPERTDLLPSVSVSGAHRTPDFLSSWLGWGQRLKPFMDEREPNANWFFMHDGRLDGAGYFAGYERVSNRRVGFIGLSGFRSQPPPSGEWIPVRGELIRDFSMWSSVPLSIYSGRIGVGRVERSDLAPRSVYVPSGKQLRLVDLAARTVTTVFEAQEPIESQGIPMLSNWSGGRATKEQPILVRTKHQIHALDHKHNVLKAFAIANEADRRSPAEWIELGDGQAIVAFSREGSPAEPDDYTNLMAYRIANDGVILDRFEIALRSGSSRQNERAQANLLAIGLPAPSILLLVDLVSAIEFGRIRDFPADLTAVIAVIALSSILAVMTWRRSRSFGLLKRERAAWLVFVLLFGLAAYVGFLLYRRWPTREPCPSCLAQAPRDRAECANCGARFPAPARKGTEIFAGRDSEETLIPTWVNG